MSVRCAWKSANKGLVVEAQQEPSHSSLCCSFHRSRDGSPRSSEGQSPLYMHSSKCSSCGCQSPQHAEMCLHTPGSNFGEEMGETQSEYSDSSCGESCIPGHLFNQQARGLSSLGTVSKQAVRPVPDAGGSQGALQSPLEWLTSCVHTCEGHAYIRIASFLPFPAPSRYLVWGVSHLLQTCQLRTGNKVHPTPRTTGEQAWQM